MRTAKQLWAQLGEDPRWIDDPEAVVAEIQREAFDAGRADGLKGDSFTAGVEAAAREIERVAPSLPACAFTLQRALPRAVRQLTAPPPPPAEATTTTTP
jgi:hypothetical protein